MEKIKKALEVAGRDRAERIDTRTPRPAGAQMESTPLRPLGEASGSKTMQPVEFTETRTARVSRDRLESSRVITGKSDEKSRAYAMLGSRVLGKLQANHWNSVAIVSPGPDEGKSLTAINLGITLSNSPERTCVVVDLDFRRPSIANYLSIDPKVGLEDVLQQRRGVSQALVSPNIRNFSILPVAKANEANAALVDSTACRDLAFELRNRYANRIVLFDLPPLLSCGEAAQFLTCVDAVLLVVAEGITKRENIDWSLNLLSDVPIVGTVLNRSPDKSVGYY